MKKQLYQLTPGDKEIFRLSRSNPNIFTDYYLRGDNTGTYWRDVQDTSDVPEIARLVEHWKKGYDVLFTRWEKEGRPEEFVHNERKYRPFEDEEGKITFHHHHGFMLFDWQITLGQLKTPTKVVISGLGAGKTIAAAVWLLIWSATLTQFRGFVLSPFNAQAMEVFQQILILLEGTLYKERFLIGNPQKPVPTIIVANDLVRRSTIEHFSVLEEPHKLLTMTGDVAMVDQAESLDDLDTIDRVVGSRFRGSVAGRERLGYLMYLANSADNPALWDRFDEMEIDPEYTWSCNPSTFDNPANTPRQLKLIERRVGADPLQKRQHLFGDRPVGTGEHFPSQSILKCRARWLDDYMEEGRKRQDPGFKYLSVRRAQVVEWEIPPIPGATNIVIADPGWSNPPERNSACIMAWDITNFPKQPAVLRAFHWVYGNGAPEPWIQKYSEVVVNFNAIGRNAFDSTGLQKGYERWVAGLQDLLPEPMDLTGAKKFIYLNTSKIIVSRGLLQYANIPMLLSQMSKYRLPDDKIKQDLVMTLVLTCGWLERMFYDQMPEDEVPEEPRHADRIFPTADRYRGHAR